MDLSIFSWYLSCSSTGASQKASNRETEICLDVFIDPYIMGEQ